MFRRLGNITRHASVRFFTAEAKTSTLHVSYLPQLRTMFEKNPNIFLQKNNTCWYSATQLLLRAKNDKSELMLEEKVPDGPMVMGKSWTDYLTNHGFKGLKLPDTPHELAIQLKKFGPLVFVTNPRNESTMLHIINVVRVSADKVTLIDNKLMKTKNLDEYIKEITFANFLEMATQDNVISAEEYFSIPTGLRPPIFNDKGEVIKQKDLPREGAITVRQITTEPLYYLHDLINKLDMDSASDQAAIKSFKF